MLDNIRDNEAMLAPHRRPAYPVNAPALVRHICVRLYENESPYMASNEPVGGEFTPATPQETSRLKTEFDQRLEALLRKLNGFLDCIQAGDASERVRFRIPGVFEQTGSRQVRHTDTLLIRLDIPDVCRLSMQLDVHNEYLTVSYLADAIQIAECRSAICTRIGKILRKLGDGDIESTQASLDVTYLYEDFWQELERQMGKSLTQELPGEIIFADFRGLALCSPELTRQLSSRHPHKVVFADLYTDDRRAKRLDRDVLRFIEERPKFFEAALGLEKSPLSGGEANSPSNVVLTGVIDGAGIYGSSLRSRSASSVTPQAYFIIYNGNSDAQLGRFMRRMHVLGELRIAALMDMSELRMAHREIRQLEREVEAAGTRGLKDNEVQRFYQRFSRAASSYCRGGVIYRVGRSDHYARAYRERLQDLRSVRIDGWQPYDDFMRRNLFLEFDYIAQIGEKFDRVARRIDRLRAILQVSALRGNTTILTKLQIEANIFAHVVGAAAFTYYFGTILHDFAIAAIASLPWSDIPLLPEHPEASYFLLKTGGFVIAFLIYLFLRRVYRRRSEKLAQANAQA